MRVVVRVRHNGRLKMVGKVFPVGDRLVFLHEAGGGSQPHRNLDSPGGIDAVVLEWLIVVGVDEIHHYDRRRHELLVASPVRVRDVGATQRSGGRSRVYLPYAGWERGEGGYRVPWITDSKDFEIGGAVIQQSLLA